MEICEEIRHTNGMKEWYDKRKECIERIFGTAKEYHGMRYTRLNGKALMEMKIGLTFACMNLKKLAKIKKMKGLLVPLPNCFSSFLFGRYQVRRQKINPSVACAF